MGSNQTRSEGNRGRLQKSLFLPVLTKTQRKNLKGS